MPNNIQMLQDTERVYTRRVNSNGDDVAPTITCTISKGVQRQLDNGGGYVLDYFVIRRKRRSAESSGADANVS